MRYVVKQNGWYLKKLTLVGTYERVIIMVEDAEDAQMFRREDEAKSYSDIIKGEVVTITVKEIK